MLGVETCVTVTCFAVVLMVKVLSRSALLTQVATVWIRTCRSRAVTIPQGRGVLRLRHQQLHLLATPLMMPSRSALKRTSTSSLRSSGCAKGPCRTGGSLIFAGNSEKKLCRRRRSRAAAAGEEDGGAAAAEGAGEKARGAGEEAGEALTNKSSFTLLLCH